jgi:hypothetical protein
MSFERNLGPDARSYYEGLGLKLIGPPRAKWSSTMCQGCGSRKAMRINTETGAFVCMAGCGFKGGDVVSYHMKANGMEFVEAAKALGCWVEDGRPSVQHKPTPLPPRAALEVLSFEANLVAVSAANVARGIALSDVDLQRVLAAANRIARLAEAYL